MKWTMISLAIAGTVTYAVIFLAHVQSERGGSDVRVAATAAAVDVQVEPVPLPPVEEFSGDSTATIERVGVSNPTSTVAAPAPLFEGDPWTAGVKAYESRDWKVATAALEEAVQENETSPYRHFLLGLTYRQTGDFEAAREELTRSLELSPAQVRALVALSRTELDLGDASEARVAIDRALEIDLDHADSWHVLGRIELEEGNLEPAAVAFRKCADRDPQHVWAHNNLGYVRILQDRFDEAVEPLKVAAESGVEEAVFFNNLGVALERSGHVGPATLAYGKALLLGSEAAEASYDRLDAILVARGETAADLETVENLDAASLVALLPAVQPSEDPAAPTEAELAFDDAQEDADGEFVENR